MTNTEIIRKVNEGFAEDDIEKILQYMADDVRWDILGTSTAIGKEAFSREVNNEYMVGKPTVKIKNELEHDDCVVIEGELRCKKINGAMLDAFFIDVYRLENGLVKEMRSYIVEKNKTFY